MFIVRGVCGSIRHFRGCLLLTAELSRPSPLPGLSFPCHRALQSQLQVASGITGAQLEEECRSKTLPFSASRHQLPAPFPSHPGQPTCLQLSPSPHSQPCSGLQFTALLLIFFPPAVLSPPGAAEPPGPGVSGEGGEGGIVAS